MSTPALTIQVDGVEGLADLRAELGSWLTEAGATNGDHDDIMLACWEATANAVEHPIFDRPAAVQVDAQRRDGHVVVCVRDNGRWREDSTAKGADGQRLALMERGRGLELIRALMDRVRVDSTARGTRVLMIRTLGSSR